MGDAVTEDWLVSAMERVADAGQEACDAIAETIAALEEGRRARMKGESIAGMVETLIGSGGREIRLRSTTAFHEWERTVASMRAGAVRALVDEDRLSLTEVAKKLLVSRQAAARLYKQGKAEWLQGGGRGDSEGPM